MPVEVNSKAFPKDNRLEVVSIFRDIRDRKEAEIKIRFLANHDYLTNLPNLRVFYDELHQQIDSRKEFLLYIV
ncbi:hypothetical protein [Paenibacillus sp. sgz302251]|uniref:hypothetical protein n=1 Tax=Paenibacillus sp. sgz302251 TaxID=3414493 RepID=UPI003C7DF238